MAEQAAILGAFLSEEYCSAVLQPKDSQEAVRKLSLNGLMEEMADKRIVSTRQERSAPSTTRQDKRDAVEEVGGEHVECKSDVLMPWFDDISHFCLVIDMKLPAVKKRRVTNLPSSLLLECRPEIMRNVYSFLTLQEALHVRRTCHQLHADNDDAFRYSCLVSCLSDGISMKYWRFQECAIMRACENTNKLCALLRNETLSRAIHLSYLLSNFVEKSKTDIGESVSILLQDGRCNAGRNGGSSMKMLETALEKGFYSMANALQQEECT